MSGSKSKKIKFWALKIFIISLVLSTGMSLIAETFLGNLSLLPAIVVLLILIGIGIVFDIVGVAFASCDQTPFIAMSAKKIKKANTALRLLKNASVVSSICNDVVGDICGIVSGASGTAIAVLLFQRAQSVPETVFSVAVAGLTAALTVGGKALGKNYAIRNDRRIVERVGAFCSFFRSAKGWKR